MERRSENEKAEDEKSTYLWPRATKRLEHGHYRSKSYRKATSPVNERLGFYAKSLMTSQKKTRDRGKGEKR